MVTALLVVLTVVHLVTVAFLLRQNRRLGAQLAAQRPAAPVLVPFPAFPPEPAPQKTLINSKEYAR